LNFREKETNNKKSLADHSADSSKKFLDSLNNLEGVLSLAELNELKENYTDLNYGDFVLIFPNPDNLKIDRYITFDEAVNLYEKSLMEKCDQEKNKHEILKEKLIFVKAFFNLEDYYPHTNSTESLSGKNSRKSLSRKMGVLEIDFDEMLTNWDSAKAIAWIEKMKKNKTIRKKSVFFKQTQYFLSLILSIY
jgi:hypothetical protein